MVSLPLLYGLVSVLLFAIGLDALIRSTHLLRRLLALNTMTSAVFLLFIAVAYRDAAPAPDPVPHAMVLTGIVVAVSATGFAIALARRLQAETGRTELAEAPGEDEE